MYTAIDQTGNGAIQNCLKGPLLHIVTLCEMNVLTIHVKPTEAQKTCFVINLQ